MIVFKSDDSYFRYVWAFLAGLFVLSVSLNLEALSRQKPTTQPTAKWTPKSVFKPISQPTSGLAFKPVSKPTTLRTIDLPKKNLKKELKKKPLLQIESVWVPSGSFWMGSPANEDGREKNEDPRRQISFKKGFWMMTSEVTQALFQQVMGYNPAHFRSCGSSCPVEMVSWHEAALFANKLSQKLRLPLCFSCRGTARGVRCVPVSHQAYASCKGWKLPTEAQWEYAARAGSSGATYGILSQIAWWGAFYRGNVKKEGPKSVKTRLPNRWGLYDMLGNVAEWVYDWYQKRYDLHQTDAPVGASSGAYRVIRGGSWYGSRRSARVARRKSYAPSFRSDTLGFRLVRER